MTLMKIKTKAEKRNRRNLLHREFSTQLFLVFTFVMDLPMTREDDSSVYKTAE